VKDGSMQAMYLPFASHTKKDGWSIPGISIYSTSAVGVASRGFQSFSLLNTVELLIMHSFWPSRAAHSLHIA
jgi:hypothetical protein